MSDSVRSHRSQPTRLPRPWHSPGRSTGVGAIAFSVPGTLQAKALEWGRCSLGLLYLTGCCVQSLSHDPLFETPWMAAGQASLSFTISWSLLKLMSIESVMPSNHLILCHPLLLLPSIFPSIRVFSNKWALCFTSGGQNIGGSASA